MKYLGLSLFYSFRFAISLEAAGTIVAPPVPPEEMTIWFDEEKAAKSIIEGADGEAAALVEIKAVHEQTWDTQFQSVTNTVPIKKGEIVVYCLRMRTTGEPVEVGEVIVFFSLKHAEANVEEGVHVRLYPDTNLKTFRRSVVAPRDYAVGDMSLSVHLGSRAQTLEISKGWIESFPAETPYAELKLEEKMWEGKALDAPWRKEAAERIEALRKADLTVRVTDPDGEPVEGATVAIDQVEHAWKFGVFVNDTLVDDSEDGERYREEVLKRYNHITVPAYLANWGWLNERHRANYFKIADWVQEHGLGARGHLLVYPGWTATPGEWFDLPKDELRRRIDAHIPRAIDAYAQRGIMEWDVTNELRYNEEFMNEIGGLEVAADWFKLAKGHNPEIKGYLSETWILPDNGATYREQDTFEGHIRTLLGYEAPIDAFAFHGHFGETMTSPENLKKIFDRFGKFDRDILVTEFDMNNDDKEAQAEYLRDFYTLCFSHPSVEGIVQWGFWEARMWKPRGWFFSTEWEESPAAKMYLDLVKGEWWTAEKGTTDAEGRFARRAFKGRQKITVTRGDYTVSMERELGEALEVGVIVP